MVESFSHQLRGTASKAQEHREGGPRELLARETFERLFERVWLQAGCGGSGTYATATPAGLAVGVIVSLGSGLMGPVGQSTAGLACSFRFTRPCHLCFRHPRRCRSAHARIGLHFIEPHGRGPTEKL